MAATELKPIYLTNYDEFVKETSDTDFVAVDATAGAFFKVAGRDEQYVIGAKNNNVSAEKTVTIKAGDSIQGAFGDITFALDAGEIAWVVLSSGKFKNVLGANKGEIVITGSSTDIQLKVIRLPY